MRPRRLTPTLLAALRDTPVVFLHGPRQAGKTTLVQALHRRGHRAEYLTFDDASVLAAARSDPDAFIDALPERVILDEVQRVPELFRSVKRNVDARRAPGRFLLTGSADALLLPRIAEFLAGRMEVLTLWPFSQGEIAGRREMFVDACFGRAFDVPSLRDSGWPSLVARIVTGGFPEAVARTDAARRDAWFGAYLTTILERDVRDLADVKGLRDMPRLLRLAAARTASLLNFAELARDAALPQTTLQRYWALFEATFLLRTLPAWSRNLGTRMVKAPKVMPCDTGLLCWLAGLDAGRLQGDEPMAGRVLECFVASELMKQSTWSRTRPALYHYRTHGQDEVDLVLEDAAGRVVGIEVKKSASPSANDFKGLRRLAEAVGKPFVRGVLLYTGSAGVAFGPDLHAVPLSALWRMTEPRAGGAE